MKKPAITTGVVWAIGVLIALCVSPLYSEEASFNCGSQGQGLQKRIDTLPEGSTLNITGSCTDGPFIIRKDLNLIGSGSATLSAPDGSGDVVIVQLSNVRLGNLNLDVSGTNTGILLMGASVEMWGLTVEGATGPGIDVAEGSYANIDSCQIRNNGSTGIVIRGSSGAFVADNTIEGNGAIGITVEMSSSANLSGNNIDGNAYGINVWESSSIFLVNNTIKNSTQDGLLVRRNGLVRTVNPPNEFSDNLGTDVVCKERGILEFTEGPQVPSSGTAWDDGTCLIFGNIF
jgi:parallel beta-helix repeat protein